MNVMINSKKIKAEPPGISELTCACLANYKSIPWLDTQDDIVRYDACMASH